MSFLKRTCIADEREVGVRFFIHAVVVTGQPHYFCVLSLTKRHWRFNAGGAGEILPSRGATAEGGEIKTVECGYDP